MNLKERNVPSAKIYIPPENLEERKKVRKFASRNDKQKGLHREIKKQQERDS